MVVGDRVAGNGRRHVRGVGQRGRRQVEHRQCRGGKIGAEVALPGGLAVGIKDDLDQAAARTENENLSPRLDLAARRGKAEPGHADQQGKAKGKGGSEERGHGLRNPVSGVAPF